MASKTVTELVDDIDGGAADRTVEIVLDGERYEIDLSTTHHHALIRDLARYMAVARRTGEGVAPTPFFSATKADPATVRRWASSRGIALPAGRPVPKDVVAQFHAAGN